MKLKFWQSRAEKVDPRHPRDPALAALYGLRGGHVDAQNAMQLTAVYAAITIISETIAGLPLHLMRRLPDGGKEKATTDPRYILLHERPNRYQTKFEFIEYVIMTLLLRGRSVCQVLRNPSGVITDLIPLDPDKVRAVRMPDGSLVYAYRDSDKPEVFLLSEEVIDVRGPSRDGVHCMSPIEQNENALNLLHSSERYARDFFDNSQVISGVLESPKPLSDKAYERLKEWWERSKQSGGRHTSAILEDGVSWKPIQFNPKDSQLLETRKYSTADIARIYRIPLYKLAELDRATFSNIEQQSLDFVVDTILPRLQRLEFALRRGILSDQELSKYDIFFNLDGLLRADSTSRGNYYKTLWTMGVLSPNEIRVKENLNPFEGGDVRTVQLNLVDVKGVGKDNDVSAK